MQQFRLFRKSAQPLVRQIISRPPPMAHRQHIGFHQKLVPRRSIQTLFRNVRKSKLNRIPSKKRNLRIIPPRINHPDLRHQQNNQQRAHPRNGYVLQFSQPILHHLPPHRHSFYFFKETRPTPLLHLPLLINPPRHRIIPPRPDVLASKCIL